MKAVHNMRVGELVDELLTKHGYDHESVLNEVIAGTGHNLHNPIRNFLQIVVDEKRAEAVEMGNADA